MTYRDKLNELRNIPTADIEEMYNKIIIDKVLSNDFEDEVSDEESLFLILNEMINRLKNDKEVK